MKYTDNTQTELDLHQPDLKWTNLANFYQVRRFFNSDPKTTVENFAWALGQAVVDLENTRANSTVWSNQAGSSGIIQRLLGGAKEAGKLDEVLERTRAHFDLIGIPAHHKELEGAVQFFQKGGAFAVFGEQAPARSPLAKKSGPEQERTR